MKSITDVLAQKIIDTSCPVCVGLDTALEYLPQSLAENVTSLSGAAAAILEFNRKIIDAVKTVVPAVKVQAAYYEMYGEAGMRTFRKTLEYAKKCGLVTIADAKRNDIGSTAECYSRAFLGKVIINGQKKRAPFECDFLTVSPYLGSDGLAPFIDDCQKYNKGIFVLVKTSNKSSAEFQDQIIGPSSEKLYELVAQKIAMLGKNLQGKFGYSAIGAVVGATHSAQLQQLRQKFPQTFFLIPGYGAQGAGGGDIKSCFDSCGLGGVVNSSRGILLAYKSGKYGGAEFDEAARMACVDMKNDINTHRAQK